MTQYELEQLYKNIAIDFKLATRKTELWKLEYCYDILHDVKKYIIFDYVTAISLILRDNFKNTLKAKKYHIGVNTQQEGDRPGSIDWEDGEGHELTILIDNTDKYLNLNQEERAEFFDSLRIDTWGPINIDTNFHGLQSKVAKTYTSGNSGIIRIDFN